MSTFCKEEQKRSIADIMEKNNIDLLAIQETECLHQPKEQVIFSSQSKPFFFIHTGARKGVGFLVAPSLQPVNTESFQEVSPRILSFRPQSIQKITFFCVYCPIDQKKNSEESKCNTHFFNTLQKELEKVK